MNELALIVIIVALIIIAWLALQLRNMIPAEVEASIRETLEVVTFDFSQKMLEMAKHYATSTPNKIDDGIVDYVDELLERDAKPDGDGDAPENVTASGAPLTD